MPLDIGALAQGLGGFNEGFRQRWQQLQAEQQAREQQARQAQIQQEQLGFQRDANTRANQAQQVQSVNAIRQLLEDPSIDDPAIFDQRFQFARSLAPQLNVDPGFLQTLKPPPDTFTKRKLTKLLDDFEKRPMSERQQAEASIYWEVGGQRYTPAQARQALGRGGMDARTGQPFAFTPPAPQQPGIIATDVPLDRQLAAALAAGDTQKAGIIRQAIREMDEQRRDPRVTDPSIVANRRFTMEQRLAAQWEKSVSPIREMRRQYTLMEAGLRRFRQGDKNGGSQAVLVTFQKILDPASVVRESEYARTAYGQSLMNKIQGFVERLQSGGAGMTDAELQAMVQTAKEFLDGMATFNAGTRARLQRTAEEYGLDPRMIFDDVDTAPTGTRRQAPAPGATPPQQPVRVTPPARAGGDRPVGAPGPNPFRRN